MRSLSTIETSYILVWIYHIIECSTHPHPYPHTPTLKHCGNRFSFSFYLSQKISLTARNVLCRSGKVKTRVLYTFCTATLLFTYIFLSPCLFCFEVTTIDKSIANRNFCVTFHRNKIESWGSHSSKVEIKLHRIVCYRILTWFFWGFQLSFLKNNILDQWLQWIFNHVVCNETANWRSIKLGNAHIFSFSRSRVISILLETLRRFF